MRFRPVSLRHSVRSIFPLLLCVGLEKPSFCTSGLKYSGLNTLDAQGLSKYYELSGMREAADMIMRCAIGLLILSAVISAGCSAAIGTNQAGETPQSGQVPPQVTAANEMAVIARLRSISSAETLYYAESGKYTTLDDLLSKQYLSDPSQGKLQGYRIEVSLKPDGFAATAVPNKYGVTGKRSFYLDQTNVLRGGDKAGSQATASDPEQ